MKYKGIPITAAKRLAKEYDKNMVIIVAWDARFNCTHVTTYGKSYNECVDAAKNGNAIKRNLLGWPEEECKDKPARQIKKERDKITNLLKDRSFNIKTF